MNTLRQAIQQYLSMRRSLGFKLVDAGRGLLDFATFMQARRAGYVTQALALAWAQQPKNVQPAEWARRLSFVRGFARYRSASDPRTQIPPPGLLPFRAKRARPYLYSDDEIKRLLSAALKLPYRYRRAALRPWVYYCFFGLLSVAGLRLSEARNLELQDVDLKAGMLTIRGTKFGKSRLVPLHASTCKVLRNYIAQREQHWAKHPVSSYLFVSSAGTRLDIGDIHRTFYTLSRKIGLRGPDDKHGPRLHDMRHRFATTTLVHWYRSHQDPERRLPILSAYLGHVHVEDTQWYLSGSPELMREAMRRLERRWEDAMSAKTSLAALLERFFTQRLMQQRQASPHTISSYRDTFRQFLKFVERKRHKSPSSLDFRDIDAPLVVAFLDDLEKRQGVSTRSRNLRLTALHSFFRYAAFEMPAYSAQIQRVLAIPSKRFNKTLVPFLTRAEVDALLAAPDQGAWSGRRDYAFLLVAVQTGLRLSEMTGLKREDIIFGTGAHVRVVGKGRKERCTPIAKSTLAVLKAWLRERQGGDGNVLFPSARGERLSVHGVQYLLNKHRMAAAKVCPSLQHKRVTVHRLRHTMAMDLLQAGVDRSVIALWLGHESVETTQIYLEATLAMKEQALAKTTPRHTTPRRYQPGDQLLNFLNNL